MSYTVVSNYHGFYLRYMQYLVNSFRQQRRGHPGRGPRLRRVAHPGRDPTAGHASTQGEGPTAPAGLVAAHIEHITLVATCSSPARSSSPSAE